MTCKNCGCEKFNIIKVHRNRFRRDGHWVLADDKDTRFIACADCGRRYLTVTILESEIVFRKNDFRVYEQEIANGQTFLFGSEK